MALQTRAYLRAGGIAEAHIRVGEEVAAASTGQRLRGARCCCHRCRHPWKGCCGPGLNRSRVRVANERALQRRHKDGAGIPRRNGDGDVEVVEVADHRHLPARAKLQQLELVAHVVAKDVRAPILRGKRSAAVPAKE